MQILNIKQNKIIFITGRTKVQFKTTLIVIVNLKWLYFQKMLKKIIQFVTVYLVVGGCSYNLNLTFLFMI